MVSWSETFEVLPAILVVGAPFAATQWFWANYMDSNLVDIAAGVVSLVATMVFLRVWPAENESGDLKTSASKMRQRWNATKWPSTTQPVRPQGLAALCNSLCLGAPVGLAKRKVGHDKATTPAFK